MTSGTQHNWHSLLRKTTSFEPEEIERKRVNDVTGVGKDNETTEPKEGEGGVSKRNMCNKINKVMKLRKKDLVWP